MITLKRFNNLINSPAHIVGFECAAWYWHFVDVVWLFLYRMIYWWGAYSYKYSVHLICQVKKIKRKLK
jgi:heme/copper-type cytochrome/quinol oxidase subunit 3